MAGAGLRDAFGPPGRPRLAEQAAVTKPVVYDHFGTRAGLLAALYLEFDDRQTALMSSALGASDPTLRAKATVIASSYVHCVLVQGRELPGVMAALAGSPELEKVKQDWEAVFLDECRAALVPFADDGAVPTAGLRVVLGAAESLSAAAANGEITTAEARASWSPPSWRW